jgi:hypothetical protein
LTCRAILRVPDNVRGKRVRCSECGLAFLIPENSSKSAPEPAAQKDKEQARR